MDTSKLKKLMIMRVFIVYILCICVLIKQVGILKKKMEINIQFWFCWWKQRSIKKYADAWDGIKNEINAINGDKENDYGKDKHEH